jgi:hypothetical protein
VARVEIVRLGVPWDARTRRIPSPISLGKAKSVVLTEKGRRGCEEAHYRLFDRHNGLAATGN